MQHEMDMMAWLGWIVLGLSVAAVLGVRAWVWLSENPDSRWWEFFR